MSSSLISILPLVSALFAADQQMVPNNGLWGGTTDEHCAFLKSHYNPDTNYPELAEEAIGFHILQTKFSSRLDAVNDFLTNNKFNTTFNDAGPDVLYMASILKINIKKAGKFSYGVLVGKDNNSYVGIKMSDKNNFACYRTSKHPRSVLCINTKHGEKVYMTPAFEEGVMTEDNHTSAYRKVLEPNILKDLQLIEYVKQISNEINKCIPEKLDVDHIYFPGIRYTCTAPIQWLEGLRNGDYRLEKAVQKIKFSLISSKAEEKLNLTKNLNSIGTGLLISEPVFIWVEKNGMLLFAGYCDESSWISMPISGKLL